MANNSSCVLFSAESLPAQAGLYHAASTCFLVSFCAPNSRQGQVFMHMGLILGYFLQSTWAWNIICASDVFGWFFTFMIFNIGQLLFVLYQLRPIKFDDEIDAIYTALFEPLRVTRAQFKRLLSVEASAQVVSLHAGECYAIENMTKTDRLGLLISGKANVLNEKHFLHHICEGEFLDSPEFESSSGEETFRVSICAAMPSKYLLWQRTALEYLFVKEAYLGQAMAAVIANDIVAKLNTMNKKLCCEDGKALDIRLPTIAARIGHLDNRQHIRFRNKNE